jgi:hypothetical protein
VATGFQITSGVRDWLSHARKKNPFLFVSDAADYLTAGMLTSSGVTVASLAQAVDDNFSTNAWHTDTAVAGAWIQADLGASLTKKFQSCILCSGSTSNAIYDVEYSDNGTVWTKAFTGFNLSLLSKAGITIMACSWGDVGAHRYWRLLLTNTPGAGAYINEWKMHEGRVYNMYLVEPMKAGVELEDDYTRRIAVKLRTADGAVVEGY